MSTWTELSSIVVGIVTAATTLKDKHTDARDARVSYCAVFCGDDTEFEELDGAAKEVGTLADSTATGPVYVTPPLSTQAGDLRVVKIRRPDETRKERGDADFAVSSYAAFKATYLEAVGFRLIERDDFEMLELVDSEFDVRAYFSHPPVEEHAGIREALTAS
jgi:hypothetical protein